MFGDDGDIEAAAYRMRDMLVKAVNSKASNVKQLQVSKQGMVLSEASHILWGNFLGHTNIAGQ